MQAQSGIRATQLSSQKLLKQSSVEHAKSLLVPAHNTVLHLRLTVCLSDVVNISHSNCSIRSHCQQQSLSSLSAAGKA